MDEQTRDNRQTYRHTGIQAYRQMVKQTDIETNSTDRQTDRCKKQTYRQTNEDFSKRNN